MENLKIAVATKSAAYGKALARGLAEESGRLSVLVCPPNGAPTERADVMITDVPPEAWPCTGAAVPAATVKNASAKSEKSAIEEQEGRLLYLVCGAATMRNMACDGGVPAERNLPEAQTIDRASPVRDILKAAAALHCRNRGMLFSPLTEYRQKVAGIFSECGGSGATAVALTLCRLIWLRTGEPTLYLNLSERDDYAVYCDEGILNLPTKKELIYYLNEGSPFETAGFFGADAYGADCLKPEPSGNSLTAEAADRLLAATAKQGLFSYVIIDGGRGRKAGELCHLELTVKSRLDMRCAAGSDRVAGEAAQRAQSGSSAGEYDGRCAENEIWNFCDAERIKNHETLCGPADGADRWEGPILAELPEDRESFEIKGEKVRISLEGMFAVGVENLAEEVLKRLEAEEPI